MTTKKTLALHPQSSQSGRAEGFSVKTRIQWKHMPQGLHFGHRKEFWERQIFKLKPGLGVVVYTCSCSYWGR